MSNAPESPAAGHFVTTHWSAVVRAGRDDPAAAQAALGELCQTYWYPLYAFIRRQGREPHDAEDLTQAFFARLLEKNFVASAKQEKGKFRSFLLAAVKGFLANEWDRQHAAKRGGFQTHINVDTAVAETRFHSNLAHALQPDILFERQWAITLLESVMAQLEDEYLGTGRAHLFERLRGCLAKEEDAQPYANIALELNLTEAAVKAAVHRLRARYREILRLEIAKTVASPDEVEGELRHLFATFSS
jgi:RNA polymerase sigma factor (sigma-70 family)